MDKWNDYLHKSARFRCIVPIQWAKFHICKSPLIGSEIRHIYKTQRQDLL